MSPLRHLRSFINERLTAAAEEIFTEFEKVTVQYEEVINRQRGLLEASNWLKTTFTPQIKLQRIDLQQQHNLKDKEIQTDPYHQDESSSLGQEVQAKEELQEVNISQCGEQVVLKEEADSFTMTLVYEESHHNEPEYLLDQDEHVPQMIKEDLQELGMSQQEEQLVLKEEADALTTAHVHEESHHTEPAFLLSRQKHIPQTRKQFSCKVCRKGFSRVNRLDKHMRIHTKKTPYFCSKCCMYFKKSSSLLNHQRSHLENMPFSCEACGRGYRQLKDLMNHRLRRDRNPHPCEICCNSFKVERNLIKHKLIHKDLSQQEVHAEQHIINQDEGFSLDLEDLRISQQEEPLVTKENADTFTTAPAYEESQHDESESVTHQHLPSSCPATESGDLMGSSHVEAGSVTDSEQKTETSLRADMKTADLTPLPSNQHDFSTATKSLTCDVCGKTFQNKYKLFPHYRVHRAVSNHACTVCRKKFHRKHNLIRHIRTHTGETPYSCQVCGKCFTTNSSLSIHNRTHTGEKPFCCQICGKCFTSNSILSTHMKTHSSEKP